MDTPKPSSKSTVCAACSAAFCKPCMETYLLSESSKDPCCPACNKPWAHTFLAETLTATFRKSAYKHHRESILHDREKARLPETQMDAVRYRDAKAACGAVAPRIAELQRQMAALPEVIEYNRVKRESMKLSQIIDAEINKRDASRPIRVELGKIYGRLRRSRELADNYGALPTAADAVAEEPERRAFMMRCVQTGCEGFVSTAYKCGLCDVKVCKDCHTVKADDAHACDPDAVASVAALRKEARPCPKCAAPISKIDGCDQIWCTLCKTAFSWNTGKIDEGTIHNPHYYQWMRETGQTIPRLQGCAANFTVVTATLNALQDVVMHSTSLSDGQKADLRQKNTHVYNSVPSYLHIREDLRTARTNDDEQLRIMRVQRLVGEIDDATWKKRLQMLEKASEKTRSWAQLLEMYVNCYADIVQPTTVSDTTTLSATYDALKALQIYVAKEAYKITKLFDCVASQSASYIWDKDTWMHLMAPRKSRRPAACGAGHMD
jgi:hypothetical protein